MKPLTLTNLFADMPEKISIIYDHYKDTCSIIREGVKRRDRLMIFVVLALGFLAFQIISPITSNVLVNDFVNFKFGLNLKLDLTIIGNVAWVLLLILTVRYFQVAVFVERQYSYVHKLENSLNKESGENVITREGKSYLDKYPIFSDWMWVLYTIIFPLLLLAVSTAKIIGEIKIVCVDGLSSSTFLNVIIFILLAISIILYLIVIHKKTKKE